MLSCSSPFDAAFEIINTVTTGERREAQVNGQENLQLRATHNFFYSSKV